MVAPELPCDDGSATTFEPYADVVCAALDGRDADVVVVAHSLAGPTGTLIAARRPVRHLVYVCAVVPAPGLSLVDQGGEMVNPDWDKGLCRPDAELRTVWVDRGMAKALFYHDCDESTVTAAISRLRPQSAYPFIAAFPLSQLPTVSCTYVACAEDRLIDPDWQVQTARNIAASLEVIPSSHSPFFSQPTSARRRPAARGQCELGSDAALVQHRIWSGYVAGTTPLPPPIVSRQFDCGTGCLEA